MHDAVQRIHVRLLQALIPVAAASLVASCTGETAATRPATPASIEFTPTHDYDPWKRDVTDAGQHAMPAGTVASPFDRAPGETPQPAGPDPKPPQDADLTVKFATLGAHHTAVVGVDAAAPAAASEANSSEAGLTPYAADTVGLGSHFQLTGGARWDRQGPDKSFTESLLGVDSTPRSHAALVYRSPQLGNYYAGIGDLTDPAPAQLRIAAPGGPGQWGALNVKPKDAIIHEAGTRLDLFDNRIALRGTLFRAERTVPATPDDLAALDDVQRTNGLEVNALGRLGPKWNLLAGYGLLDSATVAGPYPAEIGKKLADTPPQSAKLWTSYALPAGVVVGGGARYVDKRMADNANAGSVPDFVAFDASVVYHVTETIGLQLDLQNLTDAHWYDIYSGAQPDPGMARSGRLSTGFRF